MACINVRRGPRAVTHRSGGGGVSQGAEPTLFLSGSNFDVEQELTVGRLSRVVVVVGGGGKWGGGCGGGGTLHHRAPQQEIGGDVKIPSI